MAESDHLDKGEILHSLPIMLHEQEELENRLSLVTVRYRDLAAAYEPQIQDLSQRADALAIQFKELYREASEAFAENEKALAKQLSIEGREAQATCEAAESSSQRDADGTTQSS